MALGRCSAAFLLLFGAVEHGHCAEEPRVKDIVNTRILTGFKEGCDPQATEVKNLGVAVKMAYGDMRRREGRTAVSSDLLIMDVQETLEEDYSSYTRRLTSFSVRSSRDADEERLPGASARRGDASERCMISRLHLKKVGVSVVSVADCPMVAADVDVALSAFQQDDCVEFVERDSMVHVYPTFEGPPPPQQVPSQRPGQPRSLAYWLELTNVDRAWEKQSCLKEVVVGIIDTGVQADHPDLVQNMWVNEYEVPNNGIDDDRNGYIDDINGYDFYLKKPQVTDGHGHGTHCAGIIGAVPRVTGIQGVCKDVSIAGLRFMDGQGSGATSDAIEAINYALEMDFHITNNSWGGPDVSAGLLQSIKRAADIDQLFVAAAGNSGNDADMLPEYPAAYKVKNIISVAATDEADRLANFSNYGRTAVDIAAPGVFILSTFPPSTVKSLSGTSMATPVVSGIAAMLVSIRPMPVEEIMEILLASADRPRTLKNRVASNGRVNAAFATCIATKDSHSSEEEKTTSQLSRRLKARSLTQSKGC